MRFKAPLLRAWVGLIGKKTEDQKSYDSVPLILNTDSYPKCASSIQACFSCTKTPNEVTFTY
jgi:hypothetical protein